MSGRNLLAALSMVVVGCASVAQTQIPTHIQSPYEGYSSPKYSRDSMWLCRPGMPGDACKADLTATEVKPDATREVELLRPAAAPEVDCFYLYPTVDQRFLPGLHTSFKDVTPMTKAVLGQAARFNEVCAVYAPLYRQITVGTYLWQREQRERLLDVAFSDVLDAFLHYLGQYNHGRRIVLVGQSQGGEMVARLLTRLFDNDPELRKRLLVAMPIGADVEVERGKQVGGTFASVPLCQRADEAGCVVAFRTHREGQILATAPVALAADREMACVNPAADLEPNERESLARSYFAADKESMKEADAIGSVSTPYVMFRNYYTAHCVDGPEGYRYLAIGTPGADDARASPFDLKHWKLNTFMGTHFLDMQFTQGDLIDLVAKKYAALDREYMPAVASIPAKAR